MSILKRHRQDDRNTLEALSPTGEPLTLDDLPPPDTKRWVARRKAEVVSAVRAGLLSLQDACRRYSLSEDEYRTWEKLLDDHGVRGLHTTRTQMYRNIDARRARRGGKSDADAEPSDAVQPARQIL